MGRSLVCCLGLMALAAQGQPFRLPTGNRALFEKGGEEQFFVGTVGKPWITGTFGCVRTGGWQMHEGIDVRCLQRDRRSEPADPVLATADGTVAYINTRPSLSNYGNYLVLRHEVEGVEIYSLYAHLREVRRDLKAGQPVKAGEQVGVLGRTTNTRESISKERAHLHFELNLLVNDRFAAWQRKTFPDQRNDHGEWNGQNLLAIDPRAILLRQHKEGARFSLLGFLQGQTDLCRVMVRKEYFPWLRRYAVLVQSSPCAEQEGIAGYEITFNYNGVPFKLISRAPSEIQGKAKYQLLSVNESEYHQNPGRRLVAKRGTTWELASSGRNMVELLTY